MSFEPGLHPRMFVRAVIVHDEVQRRLAGKLIVEASQEFQKLLVPRAFVTLPHDFALQDLQIGKKRGGAVAFVVMGHGAATSFLQGQAGLGSIQCLNLAFLVDAEHQGLLGRIEIEAHDIGQLLRKRASRDSLKFFTRCGFRLWLRQTLLMVDLLTS